MTCYFGEEYREQLKRLALQLGVDRHLVFINKFVAEEELMHYLSAAAIYITPYTNEAQITSGTLSYAVGAAVVSTPYWHAQKLLAETMNELLSEPEQLAALQHKAYEYGRHLRWPHHRGQIFLVLKQARAGAEIAGLLPRPMVDPEIMPEFSLAHVRRLTDDTGIVQHAKYGIPNLKEGYCLDDNSRALTMALMSRPAKALHPSLDV